MLCLSISVAISQNCDGYFAFKKGTKMELVSMDKKDKIAAVIKYEVVDYKVVGGESSITFKNETYDNKGKTLASADVTGKCSDGNFYTEARHFGSDMIPKSVDMEVVVSSHKVIYPNVLKAGQKLPDAAFSVKSAMKGGMTLMTINANLSERQVAAFETVTTKPASNLRWF